ncbi:MAG: hypothetical protein R2831_05805 [Chitinophagaceae bacterium]
MFFGTDGGISKKASGTLPDNSNATSNINGYGLNITPFWGMGVSKTGKKILTGAVHDGLYTYSNGAWNLPKGISDEYETYFDEVNLNKGYTQEWTAILESTNLINWQSSLQPGEISVRSPRAAFPNNIRVMAHNNLKDINNPLNLNPPVWTNRSTPLLISQSNDLPAYDFIQPTGCGVLETGKTIMDFAASSKNTEYKWVVFRKGYFNANPNDACWQSIIAYKDKIEQSHVFYYDENNSNSYNKKWNDRTHNDFKNYTLTAITTDPDNPKRAWLGAGDLIQTQASQASNRVWYTSDAGFTWDDISNGLPVGLPIIDLVYQKGTKGVVYAATDLGIFCLHFDESNPKNSFWFCFNNGVIDEFNVQRDFPSVPPVELEIDYCSGKLMCSTHGRGVWESDLVTLEPGNVELPGITNTIFYKLFFYDITSSQWFVRNISIYTNNNPQFGMESIEVCTFNPNKIYFSHTQPSPSCNHSVK